MSEAIRSLWSKEVESVDPAPIEVLKAQVAPIKEMTKGLVEAEVLTWSGNDGFLYLLFDVVAPKLNNARHCIVGISHPETRLYPVTVQAECLKKDPAKQRAVPEVSSEANGSWSISILRDRVGNTDWPQAKTGPELLDLLGRVFQSEPVLNLIRTLSARSLNQDARGS